MAVIYDGQVHMARLAIVGGYSVNGVAKLHTEILKKQTLKDFYEMTPEKFNNKTNGITQRRFLLHGNPLLADWVTEYAGNGWITDLPKIKRSLSLQMIHRHRRNLWRLNTKIKFAWQNTSKSITALM